MRWRSYGLALLAGAALCLGNSVLHAADIESYRDSGAKVLRLGASGFEAKTVTLQGTAASREEDLVDVRGCWRGWGGRCGWGGGYRVGWGGWGGWGRSGWGGWGGLGRCGWGGYGWGGWGGYRPWSYSYCSPSYYTSWYTPVYSYSNYTPYYYSAPVYYSNGYWPCRTTFGVSVNTPSFSLALQNYQARVLADQQAYAVPRGVIPPSNYVTPAPLPGQRTVPGDGSTYQYNGGPTNPVPMPQTQPEAVPAPNPGGVSVPLEGRTISLSQRTQPSKYRYAAYGEQPAMPRTAPKQADTLLVQKPGQP